MIVVYTKNFSRLNDRVGKWAGQNVGNLTFLRPIEVPLEKGWTMKVSTPGKILRQKISVEYVTEVDSFGPYDIQLPHPFESDPKFKSFVDMEILRDSGEHPPLLSMSNLIPEEYTFQSRDNIDFKFVRVSEVLSAIFLFEQYDSVVLNESDAFA